eukprot:5670573-Lingulodinium_polyedra.AAC.1
MAADDPAQCQPQRVKPGDFGSRECTLPPPREPKTNGASATGRPMLGEAPGGPKTSWGRMGGSTAD